LKDCEIGDDAVPLRLKTRAAVVEPLAAKVDAADDFADVPADARPLVRHSAIMALAAKDPRLKNRTLT
jgi:hypothetical protein